MPKAFLNCVKKGGEVRTIKTGKNKYRHVCIMKGKSYYGHEKTAKKKKDKS